MSEDICKLMYIWYVISLSKIRLQQKERRISEFVNVKNLILEKDVKVLFSICFVISYLYSCKIKSLYSCSKTREDRVYADAGMLCFTKSH